MSDDLSIGIDGFTFPLDAAVARFVTLGKSGAGKTNGDAVMIEEFVRAGVPTIVLDPLGTMWGLRSSADGNGPGLSIAIFGGTHGDLPLPLERAEYLADFVADGVSCVFDMSLMAPEEHLEFAKAFLPRLLQRAKVNMHVNLQEADRFAPQRAVSSPVTMFSRASRNAGIGWSFSTQKPQVLHKEVIDSASAFFAMKMTGELAQEAVGGEIGSRIGKKAAARMMAELPTFKRGEAWFVPDPDWLGVDAPEWEATRMRFRLRETFEVRPPKVGEARREQITLASIDLDALRDALAGTIDEPAPANAVDVEPLLEKIRGLEALVAKHEQSIAMSVDFVCSRAERVAKDMLESIIAIRGQIAIPKEWRPAKPENQNSRKPENQGSVDEIAPREAAQGAVRVDDRNDTVPMPAARRAANVGRAAEVAPTLPRSHSSSSGELSGGAARVLAAAQGRYPLRMTTTSLALFSGWKASSGPFRSALKQLRDRGLITVGQSGDLVLTKPKHGATVTASERLKAIRAVLTDTERLYFDAIYVAHKTGLTIDEIEERTGQKRTSGPFRSALKTLRENDIAAIQGGRYVFNEDLCG